MRLNITEFGRTGACVAIGMLFGACFAFPISANAQDWKPAPSKFPMSRWAKEVSPDKALPEYPRPQLVRKRWMNLNGLWDYSVVAKDEKKPAAYQGKILVPFPIEAPLSGVGKMINAMPGRTYLNSRLWYRRSFKTPSDWKANRILLHFGAVDWEATVYLNGKELGVHRGGYDRFSFDITDALSRTGNNELVVAVWDPGFKGGYPRGKQIDDPKGIWYTPCTGIWQTVWLEPVAKTSIRDLKMVTDIDRGVLRLDSAVRGSTDGLWIRAVAFDGKTEVARSSAPVGKILELKIDKAKWWWPDSPFLYNLEVSLIQGKSGPAVAPATPAIDTVKSYFGMRKISLGKDKAGITRIFLNNQFILQNGVLDQGYWPGGNLTAPTDEALRYDIEVTKKLGYNLNRKHIKIEPQRWYYWADKLGMLVWQDIVSAGDAPTHNDTEYTTSNEHRYKQFQLEMAQTMQERFNHPSIVMWVLFNESMGLAGSKEGLEYTLFDETKAFVKKSFTIARKLDATRLIDHESGMPGKGNQGRNAVDMGLGDVHDAHCYGTNRCITPTDRASVIGEYRGPFSRYGNLVAKPGISGLVLTQITDVEKERNGLLTYDRSKFKVDFDKWSTANRNWYGKWMKRKPNADGK
jgi:beta-galactosidase/beta-glucuronidase